MKGLCDQPLPQMGPFLPNEVGSIAQHVRKGEGRKAGKDGEGLVQIRPPAVHGAMGCAKKKLLVSVVVPPAPVRVISQMPLAPSVATVTSVANDKGDD